MTATKENVAYEAPKDQPPELKLQKFYDTDLLEVPDQARDVLETYSKIPRDEIMPHILQVVSSNSSNAYKLTSKQRDQAWRTLPYPSIGQFDFLEFGLSHIRVYKEIVQRLKDDNEHLLDVGCGLGQDIRQLVSLPT
jgi:hypothetical protein